MSHADLSFLFQIKITATLSILCLLLTMKRAGRQPLRLLPLTLHSRLVWLPLLLPLLFQLHRYRPQRFPLHCR
jgi:hypothetical protein